MCVYLCNYMYQRVKNLTFPNYEFGKGKYAFYSIKLSRLAENKVCQKYQTGSNASPTNQQKMSKVEHYFENGKKNNSTTSHFREELEP